MMKSYLSLVLLFAFGCRYSHNDLHLQSSKLQKFESATTSVDSATLALIKPYSDSLSGIMGKVVAHSEVEMTNKRPEGLLGNFITDAVYNYVKTSLLPKEPFCVVINGGGLRAPLPKGDITVGRIYETLPFENTLVILKLERKQIDALVERIMSKKGEPVSHLNIVSNGGKNSWTIQNDQTESIYIYVATSDYLANGNDGYDIFKNALQKIETGLNFRDVMFLQLQEYQRTNTPIAPQLERRISFE